MLFTWENIYNLNKTFIPVKRFFHTLSLIDVNNFCLVRKSFWLALQSNTNYYHEIYCISDIEWRLWHLSQMQFNIKKNPFCAYQQYVRWKVFYIHCCNYLQIFSCRHSWVKMFCSLSFLLPPYCSSSSSCHVCVCKQYK